METIKAKADRIKAERALRDAVRIASILNEYSPDEHPSEEERNWQALCAIMRCKSLLGSSELARIKEGN